MVFKGSSQLMKYIYDILSVNWVGSIKFLSELESDLVVCHAST